MAYSVYHHHGLTFCAKNSELFCISGAHLNALQHNWSKCLMGSILHGKSHSYPRWNGSPPLQCYKWQNLYLSKTWLFAGRQLNMKIISKTKCSQQDRKQRVSAQLHGAPNLTSQAKLHNENRLWILTRIQLASHYFHNQQLNANKEHSRQQWSPSVTSSNGVLVQQAAHHSSKGYLQLTCINKQISNDPSTEGWLNLFD